MFLTHTVFVLSKLEQCAVDFDVSCGKEDQYGKKYYAEMLKNLPHAHSNWFKFTKKYGSPWLSLGFLRESYNKNKIVPEGELRIPKIFHQIWVGPKPFPAKYKKWQETWQSITGWTYKLWTDKEVENYPLLSRNLYHKEKNMGARADILRLEILYAEGGVYIDTDFECIKPEMFGALNCAYDFYCGLHPFDCRAICINNAIIGSIPGHPIIKNCIDQLMTQADATRTYDEIVSRGPGLLTQMTLKYMNQGYKDIIFPPTIFYPLGLSEINSSTLKSLTLESFEVIKKRVTKPETIAIHWWDTSWAEPDATLRCRIIE